MTKGGVDYLELIDVWSLLRTMVTDLHGVDKGKILVSNTRETVDQMMLNKEHLGSVILAA